MRVYVVINMRTGYYCKDKQGSQFWLTEAEANTIHYRMGNAGIPTTVDTVYVTI